MLKQPYGERSSWWGTEASCQQPAPIYQLREWTTLQVDLTAPIKPSDDIADTADILIATLQETLSQKHPAKLPPDSRPPENMWDNKWLLF